MMNKLLMVLLLCGIASASAEVQWLDRIVAIAGDDVVSQLELQREALAL